MAVKWWFTPVSDTPVTINMVHSTMWLQGLWKDELKKPGFNFSIERVWSNMIQLYPTISHWSPNKSPLSKLQRLRPVPSGLPWLNAPGLAIAQAAGKWQLDSRNFGILQLPPSHRRSMTSTAGDIQKMYSESMSIQNPRNIQKHGVGSSCWWHTSCFFAQESCKSWVTDSSSTMSSIVHVHDQSNPIKSLCCLTSDTSDTTKSTKSTSITNRCTFFSGASIRPGWWLTFRQ